MVRLVVIREEAPVTALHAYGVRAIREKRWIRVQYCIVELPIVHEFERCAGNARKSLWLARQTTEHASTAFAGFKRKDRAPALARRNGLGERLTLLELENQFQPPCQRVLQRRHGCFREGFTRQAEECSVLIVLNDRNDSLFDRSFGSLSLVIIERATRPAAGRGINPEAEDALLLAPTQTLVQPTDSGAGGIIEAQHLPIGVARHRRRDIQMTFTTGPSEYCLDIKASALPIFVIRRDTFGRQGFDIVDA